MATAAEIGLLAGGITAANEALFAPLAGHGAPWQNFNWRVLPATAIFALLLAGFEQVDATLAKGIAVTAVISVLVTPFGKAGAPLTNIAVITGTGPKTGGRKK